MRRWGAGKQGSREAGKQGSWEAGKLGSWEAGKQGSREAGKQGSWDAGKLGSWEEIKYRRKAHGARRKEKKLIAHRGRMEAASPPLIVSCLLWVGGTDRR